MKNVMGRESFLEYFKLSIYFGGHCQCIQNVTHCGPTVEYCNERDLKKCFAVVMFGEFRDEPYIC